MQPILYAFHLPDPIPFEDYETLLTILSPAERERVQRFRLSEDRLRSLISRFALWYHLLITDLLQPCDAPPAFRSGARGKPYLTTSITRELAPAPGTGGPTGPSGPVQIGFNVSHEGRWVLLGILEQPSDSSDSYQPATPISASRRQALEVGVDVMVPPSDPFDLKEALIPQMTIPERQALSIPLSPAQLRWTLSSLWALKEGYTKAVGDGVGFGLERIQVNFGDPLPSRPGADAPASAMTMGASLPALSVQVDGMDVRHAGWDWTIGTVGKEGSLDQVGWAMYWQAHDTDREASSAGKGREEGAGHGSGPQIRVVEWDELIRVFDRLPSHESRQSCK